MRHHVVCSEVTTARGEEEAVAAPVAIVRVDTGGVMLARVARKVLHQADSTLSSVEDMVSLLYRN
jgi:hypothetical protein